MKKTFINALYHVQFETDLTSPIEISNGIYLTEYSKELHQELGPIFEKSIGTLESDSLAASDAIIIKRENQVGDEIDQKKEMYGYIQKVHLFIHMLWLVKDNSANTELAFLKMDKSKGVGVHSNLIGKIFTTASGSLAKIKYTENELRRAIELMSDTELADELEPITKLQSEAQRLSIYFYHLQTARSEDDIAMKIANYCVALETIFSSSTNEIAHQLAERLAFFIGESPKERLEIYKTTKEAYGVRSKVNHGATLKQKKIADLIEMSTKMDELCRKVYLKISGNEELHDIYIHNKDIEPYFIELIMGIRKI